MLFLILDFLFVTIISLQPFDRQVNILSWFYLWSTLQNYVLLCPEILFGFQEHIYERYTYIHQKKLKLYIFTFSYWSFKILRFIARNLVVQTNDRLVSKYVKDLPWESFHIFSFISTIFIFHSIGIHIMSIYKANINFFCREIKIGTNVYQMWHINMYVRVKFILDQLLTVYFQWMEIFLKKLVMKLMHQMRMKSYLHQTVDV